MGRCNGIVLQTLWQYPNWRVRRGAYRKIHSLLPSRHDAHQRVDVERLRQNDLFPCHLIKHSDCRTSRVSATISRSSSIVVKIDAHPRSFQLSSRAPPQESSQRRRRIARRLRRPTQRCAHANSRARNRHTPLDATTAISTHSCHEYLQPIRYGQCNGIV